MAFADERPPSDGLGPTVGRPRGAEWRTLQADGVVWEGQVFLVGDDVDLAARLVVTHRSLAFVRGGSVALEVARTWLRPAPQITTDGLVVLSISAPGASIFAEPETIVLRVRGGHPAAGHLIAMLAGSGARRLPAPTALGADPPRPGPVPRPQVPASRAVVDDAGMRGGVASPLPEERFPWERGGPERSPSWERRWEQPERADEGEAASPLVAAAAEPLVRRAAALEAVGPDRNWNLEPIKGLLPRGARRRRGWSIRIGGLFVLLALAGGAGALTVPNRDGPTATEATAGSGGAAIAQATGDGTVDSPPPQPVSPPSVAAVPTGVGGGTSEAGAEAGGAAATTDQAAVDGSVVAGSGEDGQVGFQAPIPTSGAIPEVPAATSTTAALTPPAREESSAGPAAIAPDRGGAEQPAPEPALAKPEAPAVVADEDRPRASATALTGSLRLSVERVSRGATLPEYGLAGSGANEWVAVTVAVESFAGMSGELAMSDFRLVGEDDEVIAELDSGTSLVAELAGLVPAYGRDDVVKIGRGEDGRVVLVYQVPAGSDDIELEVGDKRLALASANG